MALGGSLAGVARVVLRVDDTQFTRDLERDRAKFRVVTNDMNRDSSNLARGALAGSGAFHSLGRSIAFASGTFLGAAGFTAVVRQSISAASDLNEQMNKVRVVFQDGAKDVIEFSKTTTNALGISQQEALATAGTFGNMLVPMGYARKEAAGMSINLVKLAADMASFNNADPAQVLEALRSGLAGEAEPLRRFGVQLSDVRERQILTEAGVKNLGGTLTAQQRSWAAYQLILRDTADAQGDFSRTSGGLANQQRILHAQLQQTEAQIGKALLPAVLDITKGMTGWLSKTENQQRLQRDVNEVVVSATDIFHGFKTAVEQVDRVTGGFKQTMELLLALKVVSVLAGWTTSLTALIGTEAAAGSAGSAKGLAGAAGLSAKLRSNWAALGKLGGIGLVVTLAVEGEAVSDWLRNNVPGLKSIHDFTKKIPFNDFNPLDPPWEWGRSKSAAPKGGSRIPDYTAKPGGGAAYPLGTRGQIIGTPGAGTHSFTQGPNNWESDNAIDIAVKVGTPVLAVADGTIGQQIGPLSSSDPRMAGLRLHLIGDNGNEYYYAHLSVLYVKAGQRVRKGQTLGLSGSANGTAHLHFASRSGNPLHFANVDVATPTGTGGSPPPSAATTKKKSSAGAVDLTAMPGGISLAYENAVGAGDVAAQIAALRKFIAVLDQRKDLAKKAADKADIQAEINQTRDRIKNLRKPGTPAKPATPGQTGGGIDAIGRYVGNLSAGPGSFLPGLTDAISNFGALSSGFKIGQQAIAGGLGTIDVRLPIPEATEADWNNVIKQLSDALGKAMKKRKALTTSLARAQRARHKNPTLIKNIKADIQNIDGVISDLRGDISDAYSSLAELQVANDQAVIQANKDAADQARQDASDAFNARADYLTGIPADLRLQQVMAEGTTNTTVDDLAALRSIENLTVSRIGEAQNDPGQVESLIALEARLNQLRAQEADLLKQTTDTLSDANSQLVAYLQARRDITRTYADTVFGRQLSGTTIVLQNTFANVPADPHLYSQNLAFELQALT